MTAYSNSWLSRAVSWLQQTDAAAERGPDGIQVDLDILEEHSESVGKLETLYTAVQNCFRESHKVIRP